MSDSDPHRERLAPPPVAADVGIVMAMPIEAGYLLDGLKRVRRYAARAQNVVEGELGGQLVTVIVAGVGRAAARRGAELLIAGHRPRLLISAGFAGALDPALNRNDLVVPHEVMDPQGESIVVEALSPLPTGIEHMRGRLLTVDEVVTGTGAKAELRSRHQADLIDMETIAVARLARERSLKFLPVRIVSDTANEELPAEIASLMSRSGSYRVGLALRTIWRRPAAVKDFVSLHARAMESADRLARCLTRIMESLPTS